MAISCSAAQAADRKLDIAATEWPPFYGSDLEKGGFITEIIREAFKRKGYQTDISFLPWKRALGGAKEGKHDALFTVWYRKEREEWFVFSDPLPANELGFFKRKDKNISSVKYGDLKPYTIGVVRGYAAPPGFEEAGLKIALAKDDEENLRKLQKGRVDMVLTDKIVATHILNTKLRDESVELEWLAPPVHVDIQYLVISKKTPDYAKVLAEFNKGLASMTADGTLKSIMRKRGF